MSEFSWFPPRSTAGLGGGSGSGGGGLYQSKNEASGGVGTFTQSLGGNVGGLLDAEGSGSTADIQAEVGSLAFGNVHARGGSSSLIRATGYTGNPNYMYGAAGNFAGGTVKTNGGAAGQISAGDADNYSRGNWAFGDVTAQGAAGTAYLRAGGSNYGNIALGRVYQQGSGIGGIDSFGNGSIAAGFVRMYSSGNAHLRATSPGAIALGYSLSQGSQTARLQATNSGAFAGGFARADSTNTGYVRATGAGSWAFGYARHGSILASGRGAVALGYAGAAEAIEAIGNSSVQFGPGSNSLADSVQFGTGIRIVGTTGDHGAGTPANGDIWQYNSRVYVRTNGYTRDLTFTPTS